jgi:hypothetical protein
MKKILVLFLILFSLFSLGGCVENEIEYQIQEGSMFVIVENTEEWKIVYNNRTKVMYAVSDGTRASGTFTLLVNSDGTPMLWDEE